jgi:hypothetical protein
MAARIFCTGVALLLAAIGFFANPVMATPLSPFGILLLAISGIVWFGWDVIRDAYAYREEICPNNGRAFLQIRAPTSSSHALQTKTWPAGQARGKREMGVLQSK